tara:strand:+ start:756 stop:962 length:207 start_codon:yes stop_codon:yes gene_type:complete
MKKVNLNEELCCPRCKKSDIEVLAWTKPNALHLNYEPIPEHKEDGWCYDCDENFTFKDVLVLKKTKGA